VVNRPSSASTVATPSDHASGRVEVLGTSESWLAERNTPTDALVLSWRRIPISQSTTRSYGCLGRMRNDDAARPLDSWRQNLGLM